jgi:hypothetical protein
VAIGERSFGTIGGLVMFASISPHLSRRWPTFVAAAVCFLALLVSPELTQAQFTQQGPKLVGTGAVGPAEQGQSVALSADGDTAIVGGAGDNSRTGAAWVYTRSGEAWTQQGPELVGPGAVALSGDGNTAIVGGSVFTRSNGVWTQQGPELVGPGAVNGVVGAHQGWSVSLSADGNTAIMGGPFDNQFNPSVPDTIGAAWVFTRSDKLVGDVFGFPNAARQGWSVALSGDGNTAIVGGPLAPGAAWVFTRSNGVWVQQGPKLVGTGAVGNAQQGQSVALSADGNTAMVGGWLDTSQIGAAWVYTRSNGIWSQQGAKLVGSGAVGNALNRH